MILSSVAIAAAWAAVRENYHTHTWRCKHASGDALDYARIAQAQGCEVLGISDHCPMPDGRWASVRMAMDQLDDYASAVHVADRECPGLQVLLGLECEYLPVFHDFYAEELLGRLGCRYLVGAVHFLPLAGSWCSAFGTLDDPRLLRSYVEQCQQTLASGLFAFLAHPDLPGCSPLAWGPDAAAAARDICQAAVDCDLPLELNTYGLRKPLVAAPDGMRPMYPWPPFWEVAADCGVEVLINSDAHSPGDVCAGEELVLPMLIELGLERADMRARLGLSAAA
jgi:histidinol-phosphatase (PHP family)